MASGSASLLLLLSYIAAILVAGLTTLIWLSRQERQPVAGQGQEQPQPARRPRRGLHDLMERDQPRERARAGAQQEAVKPTKYEEKMAAKDAARVAREDAEEQARLMKISAEQARIEQEYEQWKGLIVEEAQGALEAGESTSEENRVDAFVAEIARRKIVAIEDLVAAFDMGSAQSCLDRIRVLEGAGRLSGIVDDRGKYIYVSPSDLDRVAQYISEQGRVNVRDVVAACNRIIDVTAVGAAKSELHFDADDDGDEIA